MRKCVGFYLLVWYFTELVACSDISETLLKTPLLQIKKKIFPWQDMMLFCDACDKGFHMNCHEPSLEKKPQGI
jgi:hypothetical protein